jgi:hypothetical protein
MFAAFKVGRRHPSIDAHTYRVACRSRVAITDITSQIACDAVMALPTEL